MKNKISLLIFLIGILALKCVRKEEYQLANTTTTSKTNEVAKMNSCDSLINKLNKNKLENLTYELSTSTILSAKKAREFVNYSKNGIFGHYSLFYESKSKIRELGELIVYTPEEPSDWKMFSSKEKIVSITLNDPTFQINDFIGVGKPLKNIEILGNLEKKGGNLYRYKSDCEELILRTNSDNIITSLTLKRK